MKKFRCPYCKEVFGEEAESKCPKCGKIMQIPFALRDEGYQERKKAKQRIAREAERKKMEMGITPNLKFGRKPSNLLLIVAIMVVVGGLLISRSKAPESNYKQRKALYVVSILNKGLEGFKKHCGRYPTNEEGLGALIENPGLEGWGAGHGRYVNVIPLDPWENSYFYSVSNDVTTIISCGKDGLPNTSDDVFPELQLLHK